MRWEDERYVRVYTRDTGDWLMWPWQTRAVLLFILRKVDRAGILHLGKGGLRALAAVIGMPVEEVTAAIEPLIDDGCVQLRDGDLFVPNFTPAQEANSSDRARKEASRERSRDKMRAAIGREPTSREVDLVGHTESQPVTPIVTSGHTESHDVTSGHSVPCCAVPNRAHTEARASEVVERDPKPENPYDLARRVWADEWQRSKKSAYTFSPNPSAKGEDGVIRAIGQWAAEHGGEDAERFARHLVSMYLRDKDPYVSNPNHPIKLLGARLNQYGEPPRKRPPESATRVKVDEPAEVPLSAKELAERAAAFAKKGAA